MDTDKQMSGSDHTTQGYNWPLSYMKREVYREGDTIFKKGDKADKMFYIKKGSIYLPEIKKVISAGHVIGEMGIFSPYNERTASAVCQEDVEAYTMGKDEVIKFFGQDPNLAITLIQTSFKRFIENLKRETEAKERIESELRIARDIQASMLPQTFPPFPDRKEFEIFALMEPAKEVGGDFYDFFFVEEDKLCFFIGDVSGKGVPAALFMSISKTLLKTEALRGLSARDVVDRVNNILCPDNQMCMFVTVFCVILDLVTGEVDFSNGGHNPPLICGNGRCFEFINIPKGCVLGAIENSKSGSGKLTLSPGDTIFLYTDGVTEAMNPKRELFSEARLKESLAKLTEKNVTEIAQEMREELRVFAQEEPQSDDITMLVLKYYGKR